MRALLALVVLAAACYRPDPVDGGFRCSPDLGGLCPSSLVCSKEGLCVRPSGADLAQGSLDLGSDQRIGLGPRSCDQRIQEGAFSGLVALGPANTAADEGHLAVDPTGAGRLLFLRGGQLFSAAFVNGDPKQIANPQPVSLVGGPTTLLGGSVTMDGKYWFAGSTGGTTSLYAGTPVGTDTFTVDSGRQPSSSTCPYSDPVFVGSSATQTLFVAFPLAGCAGASYLARGLAERNIQAFYSALVDPGWDHPSLSPTGLTLVVRSTVGAARLHAAARSDFEYQFTTASRIPMAAIGESIQDHQLVVSTDCRTAYFSSERAGGAGGADLYAAEIDPE